MAAATTADDPKKPTTKTGVSLPGGGLASGNAQDIQSQTGGAPLPDVEGSAKIASKYANPVTTAQSAAKDPEGFTTGAANDALSIGTKMNPMLGVAQNFLGGSPPMPEQPNAQLDDATKGLIASQEAHAGEDLKSIVANRLAGTDYGKDALNSAMEGQKYTENALGGPSNASFLDAIQRKQGKSFEGEMGAMQQRAQLGAVQEQFNRNLQLNRVKQQQLKNQQVLADAEFKYKRNVQAAKNKALGGILGLAGTGVGAALGGTTGAAAGSKAGGLAGNQETEAM